jgi:hypothetical protein
VKLRNVYKLMGREVCANVSLSKEEVIFIIDELPVMDVARDQWTTLLNEMLLWERN